MNDEELQKQGARCRAAGGQEFNCPLYKEENMPAKTGESVEIWQAKVDQWLIGFRAEDAMRG